MAMAANSEAYVASVTQIKASAAVWDTVNKAMITPGVVTATEGVKVAARTAALTIPTSRASLLMAAIASGAIGYAGDRLIEYLSYRGFSRKAGDQDLQYNYLCLTGDQYLQALADMGTLLNCTQDSYKGSFATQAEASTAVGGGSVSLKNLSGGISAAYSLPYSLQCGDGNYCQWAVYPTTPGSGAIPTAERDATSAEIATLPSLITNDLNNNWYKTTDALRESLGKLEKALEGVSSQLSNNIPTMNTLKQYLNDSIPSQTTTDLQNDLTSPTATQTYVDKTISVSPTTGSGSQTKEETQDAVKKALDDETGVTQPTEPTLTQPEKSNITEILTTFTNSINNLAFVQTLQGINLVASGSSVLCLDLPSKYGGSTCWDASAISSELSTAGTGILSVVTMLSFIMIFRG